MTSTLFTKGNIEDGRRIGPSGETRAHRAWALGYRLVAGLALLVIAAVMPQASYAQQEKTLYRTLGYGYLIEVDSDTEPLRGVVIYQSTESSLLPVGIGYMKAGGEIFLGDPDDENESVYLARMTTGDEARLYFPDLSVIALELLPSLPTATILEPTEDPQASFQVAWEFVEQYCSLIPLVQVDWRQRYDDFSARVTASTTDEQLFDLLSELITPLRDGHTSLVSSALQREFSPGPTYPSSWVESRVPDILAVISQRTDGGLMSEVEGIQFGSIGDLGYLSITEFFGYAPDERDDDDAFAAAIDNVLASMRDKRGLIIDLRLNPGGSDHVSLALAERFTDRTRLALSKMARVGEYDEFGELQEIYYSPEGTLWGSRPVVLLTSRNTGSAAEIATMALGDLPNVTLIGEPTYGAFSNAYSYVLPNGWEMSLSTELYFSSEGINYEQLGYPVDVAEAWSQSALDEGRDNILEKAIAHLAGQGPTSCQANASTLCLQNGRFSVRAVWRDFDGQEGVATAAPMNDEFGQFWFFTEKNVELGLKVLDGRSINQAFWVYLGSLSNIEFRVTVVDTETGVTQIYHNPLGRFASLGDTTSFSEIP